jgi:hypothetical protein
MGGTFDVAVVGAVFSSMFALQGTGHGAAPLEPLEGRDAAQDDAYTPGGH